MPVNQQHRVHMFALLFCMLDHMYAMHIVKRLDNAD